MTDERRPPRVSPLELTTLLVRHHGLHEGLWTLDVQFNAAGFNNTPPGLEQSFPAVTVSMTSIGLVRPVTPDHLTVDAAAVNPARTPRDTVRRQSAPAARAKREK